jgi:hypothetical protein
LIHKDESDETKFWSYEMSREQEKQLVQRWVDAAHSELGVSQSELDEWNKYLYHSETFFSFYNGDWPEFQGVDEFPYSGITLDECIEYCLDQELSDDDIPGSFRAHMESAYESYYFHFLTGVVAGDGRSALVLVSCHTMGQAGTVQEMAGVFTTSLAAEMSLRADGYIFAGDTPSGQADTFTDDEIIEMVRKAAKRLGY